jgi:hypothetical protein
MDESLMEQKMNSLKPLGWFEKGELSGHEQRMLFTEYELHRIPKLIMAALDANSRHLSKDGCIEAYGISLEPCRTLWLNQASLEARPEWYIISWWLELSLIFCRSSRAFSAVNLAARAGFTEISTAPGEAHLGEWQLMSSANMAGRQAAAPRAPARLSAAMPPSGSWTPTGGRWNSRAASWCFSTEVTKAGAFMTACSGVEWRGWAGADTGLQDIESPAEALKRRDNGAAEAEAAGETIIAETTAIELSSDERDG